MEKLRRVSWLGSSVNQLLEEEPGYNCRALSILLMNVVQCEILIMYLLFQFLIVVKYTYSFYHIL